jgi:dimethylhistidine N-methyltransferase
MPNDSLYPPQHNDVAQAALAGLLAERKTLPPKLFYDEAGCRLFYRITELPEYYLTRTERRLLERAAPAVAAAVPSGSVLVEYGASDEEKAGYLLRHRDDRGTPRFAAYVPIDVAEPALDQMRDRLRAAWPGLAVLPVAADFMQGVALPPLPDDATRLGFFPGSTIGNLEPPAAGLFLRRAREMLGADGWFLLGADLRKDPAVLLPAYDDPSGVTAAFNLNLLTRLNREASADFDLSSFQHRTVWNDPESRIEMHLVSRHDQIVTVAGRRIFFREGETIHTENSYKHTPERLIGLAARAGWSLTELWGDPDRPFALFLFRADAA